MTCRVGRAVNSSASITGAQGTCGYNSDPYRAAARERGLLPRQMQSVTWEAVRGLFQPTFKANPRNLEAIDNVWARYSNGKISLRRAQDEIHDLGGGIREPSWSDMDAGD
jgi:hypothetical protein